MWKNSIQNKKNSTLASGSGIQASDIWQISPEKPILHKHLIVETLSHVHDPPFKHGLGVHLKT